MRVQPSSVRLVSCKRGSRKIPQTLFHMRIQCGAARYEPVRDLSPKHYHGGTLMMFFPASRTVSDKFLLLKRYLVCDTVIATQTD